MWQQSWLFFQAYLSARPVSRSTVIASKLSLLPEQTLQCHDELNRHCVWASHASLPKWRQLDAAILFIWKVLMCYVTYMLCDIKLLLYNVKQSTYNLWYNMLPQKWYKLKKCYITFACKVAKMARARCSYPIMILLSPVLSANATTHHLLGASAPAQNAGQGSVSTLCQLVSNGINWNQVGSSKWQKSSFRATLQEKCFFLCLWVRSTFTAHNKLTKAE